MKYIQLKGFAGAAGQATWAQLGLYSNGARQTAQLRVSLLYSIRLRDLCSIWFEQERSIEVQLQRHQLQLLLWTLSAVQQIVVNAAVMLVDRLRLDVSNQPAC
jgi:hypothetical protein